MPYQSFSARLLSFIMAESTPPPSPEAELDQLFAELLMLEEDDPKREEIKVQIKQLTASPRGKKEAREQLARVRQEATPNPDQSLGENQN